MKKVFYLSTCDTCKRILKQLKLQEKGFIMQDIKKNPVSESDLEMLHALAGSYEALFSRTAKKYKELKLSEQTLSENDYMKLLLQDYTFLKRPVIVNDKQLFVGNSKVVIELAEKSIF
jgi:arsenate reductase (glutaredoxin)